MSRAGGTATGAAAALLLVNPKDPGVWPLPPLAGEYVNAELPPADSLQVFWDLTHAPGSDAREAAVRWRALLHGAPMTTSR